MKNNGFLKGAAVLIIFNLIGKVLGAVYRIPLAKILGTTGMGMYQLVFPLYCLILTISTTGMPVAISKLIAENNSRNHFSNSKKILRISLLILTIISFIGATFVILSAKIISSIQGNVDIFICYYGIAPAILFVGVLSAFRGFFQGNLLMFPTAISSFIEQIVKMFFGLFLANKFLQFGIEYAVLGALIGVSISELVAAFFLFVYYIVFSVKKRNRIKLKSESFKVLSSQIFSLAVPVTLGGLVGPIVSLVDSLLVVNLLMFSGYSSGTATTLLGLQSGVVEPLVNIPVIIAVSISTAILPRISKFSAENSKEEIDKISEKAFQTSLCISISCAICFVIFGKQILSFLYGGTVQFEELEIATKLLFFGSFNIVILSLVQVSAGVLQGLGYSKVPVKSLIVGCIVKIIFDLILIPIDVINIYGVVISGAICYVIVFAMNFSKIKKLTGFSMKNTVFYVSVQALFVCLFAFVSNMLSSMILSSNISLFVSGIVTVSVFFITYYIFFMYEKEDFVIQEKNT